MKNLAELLALALATVPSQADIASCHRWSRGRGMRRQRWLTIMLVLAWAGCSPVEGPGGQGPEVSDGAGHDGAADLPSDGQSELPTLSDTIQPGDLTEPSDAGAPGDPVPGDVSPDSLADVNGDGPADRVAGADADLVEVVSTDLAGDPGTDGAPDTLGDMGVPEIPDLYPDAPQDASPDLYPDAPEDIFPDLYPDALEDVFPDLYPDAPEDASPDLAADCVWHWGSWGPCTGTCPTGTRSRTVVVDAGPLYGGEPCPTGAAATETGACSLAGSSCDDGNACTEADTCDAVLGCSGVAMVCSDGDLCTKDSCDPETGCGTAGLEPGPCQWPGQWSFEPANPVLVPTPSAPPQGLDNVYAPDVLWHQEHWWMWYGGQGSDGHDAIFLARSTDLVTWQKHVTGSNPVPVVDHGSSSHVNDPSVVRVGGTFYMYFTEAPTGEEDRIHLATSQDGVSWTKHGMVLDVGPAGSWESDRVGRPSVLYEEGQFRMWYDGQIYGVARHVGYAVSADGYSWSRHPGNPIVLNQGAVDVDRVGDWYVMLAEAGSGIRLFVARNPLEWQHVGMLWGLSGQSWDAYGHVTPFLLTQDGAAKAILFGGASHSCWCKNRIGLAWPSYDCSPSCTGKVCGGDGCGGSCGACPGGQVCSGGLCTPGTLDCSACLAGFPDCTSACLAQGFDEGHCAAPGSTDPGACCACSHVYVDCEGCLVGHPTCHSACQGSGFPTGSCAHPGSTNPDQCCACTPWANCQGCLGGFPHCDAACQASGHPGGHCANPSSTDPGSCCACDSWSACQGCLVGFDSCEAACQDAGWDTGHCPNPSSTDPGNCCACENIPGCEGCLGAFPSCDAACQANGMNGGWCAVPGSQDPGACCACY